MAIEAGAKSMAEAMRRPGLCVGTAAVTLTLALLVACSEGTEVQPTAPRTSAAQPKTYNLTVYGYNYTDEGIYSFEVNGQGGGNLYLSTPTSAGGSGVCCISLSTPVTLPKKFKVRWTRGLPRGFWCEQEVMLRGPVPPDPEYFEVHFYQDGHIEVAVTPRASPPRLKLPEHTHDERHATGNVINDDKFAFCKHGY